MWRFTIRRRSRTPEGVSLLTARSWSRLPLRLPSLDLRAAGRRRATVITPSKGPGNPSRLFLHALSFLFLLSRRTIRHSAFRDLISGTFYRYGCQQRRCRNGGIPPHRSPAGRSISPCHGSILSFIRSVDSGNLAHPGRWGWSVHRYTRTGPWTSHLVKRRHPRALCSTLSLGPGTPSSFLCKAASARQLRPAGPSISRPAAFGLVSITSWWAGPPSRSASPDPSICRSWSSRRTTRRSAAPIPNSGPSWRRGNRIHTGLRSRSICRPDCRPFSVARLPASGGPTLRHCSA